jgi:hypothetical protein
MRAAFAVLLACTSAPLGAATWIVNTSADSANAQCPAQCSLRAAVTAADPGDRIGFDAALGAGAVIRLQLGEIALDKSLIIEGPGADRLTIDGNQVGRIFQVQGVNASADVTIRDLTLAHGAAIAPNGLPPFPPTAEGGAIRIGFGDRAHLERVEFSNNIAFGGVGGAGSNGVDGSPGANGSDGGAAVGGAIANHGFLTLVDVLFHNNYAIAGSGGWGGHGGDSAGAGGDGGDGGFGGSALGGALFSDGSVRAINVSFYENHALAGAGGVGGDGGTSASGLPGDGGDGGGNGSAAAGAVHVLAGTADFSFTSVHRATATQPTPPRGGNAGGLGASAGATGSASAAGANALTANGITRFKMSLLDDGNALGSSCDPAGNAPIAIGENRVGDAGCGAGFSEDPSLSAAFVGLADARNGVRALAVAANGQLQDRSSDCQALDGSHVDHDGRGARRPTVYTSAATPCDLGAFEHDPFGLFADGFER